MSPGKKSPRRPAGGTGARPRQGGRSARPEPPAEPEPARSPSRSSGRRPRTGSGRGAARELVFQDDEELEERFRQAEGRLRPRTPPRGRVRPAGTDPAGDEPETGFATAMIDGVLSAVRSVLEGLGLVSPAEAEGEAANPAPCAETAGLAGRS
ncbi:hypothetical protein GBA65_18485 [Rubrobacter marinus]|uniref:Uncharacterized protein n=1 Tax=Rubrobacter marinus TaxID=2653852 RepID=A0A6G8Q131_9ACTN|nr:hypothetical protein [Rubrobacter marinus]QIN80173.1 hypothetical protein GBA65_18485 [Rubrobacter marinus]